MIKKWTAVLLCVVLFAAMLPFGVSAAESAAFKIRLAEQTDKTATVVVEFAGGTGFCALDMKVKYNTLKLTLQTAKIGSGYSAFKAKSEDAGAVCISMINSNENPIKVSMANTDAFAPVDGDSILVRMTFSKIDGTKISESDVQLSFENCQTGNFTDITTSISYDLTAPTVAEDQTAYAQQTSNDSITDDNSGEIGESVSETASGANTAAQNSDPSAASASSQDETAADETETTETDEAETNNKTKTIAIVVVCVVLVGGVALGTSMIIKNKKKSENEF